jgi:hypothetical protein
MTSGSPGSIDPAGVTGGSNASCGGGTGMGPDGGTCNDIVNDAPMVSPTVSKGALPVGTGGTIADGTYALTKYEIEPTSLVPATLTISIVVVIHGSALQVAQELGGSPSRTNYTLATTGNQITLAPTCGLPPALVWTSYTATPASYTLYAAQAGAALTWTKQ